MIRSSGDIELNWVDSTDLERRLSRRLSPRKPGPKTEKRR